MGKEHFYSLSPSFATLSFALTALSGLKVIAAGEKQICEHYVSGAEKKLPWLTLL